jgi:hypothetical protein
MISACRPYLSIVVTGRNDDHGSNLRHRTQVFIENLLEQSRYHKLDAELIFVEWNPNPGVPRVAEQFRWPVNENTCKVRIIEVPHDVHQRFQYAERLSLFQMIGKNVGIRRARGEYVLATNIDLLFSDELIAFLAQKQLRPDRVYRLDRWDVHQNVPLEGSVAERLQYCASHLIRRNMREGTLDLRSSKMYYIYRSSNHIAGLFLQVGDFLFGATQKRMEFIQNKQYGEVFKLHGHLQNAIGESGARIPALFKRLMEPEPPHLHTNACGDFTLIDKRSWMRLKAYPEYEMYSFHIDSLLLHMAHHLGLREVVLSDPMRIYHIEHDGGYKPETKADQSFDKHFEERDIPRLSDDEYHQMAVGMRKSRAPLDVNSPDWGLAELELPERSPQGASMLSQGSMH